MKFEKQAKVMAKSWLYMLKTGIISRFIKYAYPEKTIDLPTIDQNQESIFIATLQERLLKTIENNPHQFEKNEFGLNWSMFSSEITTALKKANIIIEDLNKIEFRLNPHIYMNSHGEISVNNGQGCHFIYYVDSSLRQSFFGNKNYSQRLDEIYKEYFNNNPCFAERPGFNY